MGNGNGRVGDRREEMLREVASVVAAARRRAVLVRAVRCDAFRGGAVLIVDGGKGAHRPQAEDIGQEKQQQDAREQAAQASSHARILTQAQDAHDGWVHREPGAGFDPQRPLDPPLSYSSRT